MTSAEIDLRFPLCGREVRQWLRRRGWKCFTVCDTRIDGRRMRLMLFLAPVVNRCLRRMFMEEERRKARRSLEGLLLSFGSHPVNQACRRMVLLNRALFWKENMAA